MGSIVPTVVTPGPAGTADIALLENPIPVAATLERALRKAAEALPIDSVGGWLTNCGRDRGNPDPDLDLGTKSPHPASARRIRSVPADTWACLPALAPRVVAAPSSTASRTPTRAPAVSPKRVTPIWQR